MATGGMGKSRPPHLQRKMANWDSCKIELKDHSAKYLLQSALFYRITAKESSKFFIACDKSMILRRCILSKRNGCDPETLVRPLRYLVHHFFSPDHTAGYRGHDNGKIRPIDTKNQE